MLTRWRASNEKSCRGEVAKFNEQFVLRKSGNLIPLWREAGKIDHRCEQNEGNLRWTACWIARRSRDDRGDVIARRVGRGYTTCNYWRSSFGFHSARSVSFHYGQGKRLQSSQATRRWVDDSWSTRGWRNGRSDLWIVLAPQSWASFSALDYVDIRFVADRYACDRALAGFGHELHWLAHRRCASGHASWFRPMRFSIRTNTRCWFSICYTTKNRRSGLRIQPGDRTPCFCPWRNRSCGYGRWNRVGSQALSCRDLQLRRHPVQRSHCPADHA